MKIFWKIFFATMIISISCFSIGSYILINSNFKSSLKREIDTTYIENDILNFTLSQELDDISEAFIEFSNSNSDKANYTKSQWITQIAPTVNIGTVQGKMNFRISNDNGKIIYENLEDKFGNEIIKKLDKNTKAHEIVHINSKYYIHAIVPMQTMEETFYIQNFTDISHVFDSLNNQYKTFIYIVIIMIAVSGIVSFFVSWLILKPIYRLSKATQEISRGNFEQRVYTKAKDETGDLADNFNLMAENLDTTVKELKDLNVRQESFIGSFAHETKTPLTSMIGYAYMLRSKKLSQEEIMLSANYIFEEGKRVEALSMKLLDLIILKKREFKMYYISTGEFFEEINGIMHPSLRKHNIEFSLDVDEEKIYLEPDFLKTVFINLIDNSIKAINAGQLNECGKISLLGRRQGEDYIVTIEDNGKGMEESELSRITEAFYMVDKSRARSQGGAGLGLAICVEIIKLHNGEILFESKLNEGTRVIVKLRGEIQYEKR